MRTLLSTVSLLAVMLLLGGCATEGVIVRGPTYEQAAKNPFVPTNYRAAEALLSQLEGDLESGQPLIIATIVNIDELNKSSTLGRLVSEQVSSRFAQAGYNMIEMKFRSNVYMLKGQGEMMLTRELQQIARSHDAQAVVVGTYGESSEFIYVNLKVIDPASNIVLAAHDYTLPRDANTRAMLRKSR